MPTELNMIQMLNKVRWRLDCYLIFCLSKVCVTLLIRLPLLALAPLPPPPLSLSGSRSPSILSRSGEFLDLIPVPLPLATGSFSALHLPLPLRPQVPHSDHASVPFPVSVALPVLVSVAAPFPVPVPLGHQRGQSVLRNDWLGDMVLFIFRLQDTFVEVELEETQKNHNKTQMLGCCSFRVWRTFK